MSMQDLMDRIQNYLLGDDVNASYYNGRILVGSKYLDSNMGPPCIVIVPTGGVDNTTTQYPGRNSNPSGLRTKNITFDAVCWGSTRDDCEMLQAAILTACFYAVDGPTTYIDTEVWDHGGFDAVGYKLLSSYRVEGFVIPRIKLPLDKPISSDTDKEVTLVTPITLDTPVDALDTTVNFNIEG